MDPLIKISDAEFGANAAKMKYDHITPPCSLCARQNMGVLNPGYLALRGHWALVAELGVEAFFLDSRLDVGVIVSPSGKRKALVVDLRFSRGSAVTVHEECAEKAVNKLGALRGVEEAWGEIEAIDPDTSGPMALYKSEVDDSE